MRKVYVQMFPINRKLCVWITKLIRPNFYISGTWYQCPSLKALIVGIVIYKACQIYSTYLANVSLSLILTWILCVCAKSLHLCPTLSYPMDCSPPGSSVHEILQTRILEWVAMASSSRSSQPRDWTHLSCGSCTAGKFFTDKPPGKPTYKFAMYIKQF